MSAGSMEDHFDRGKPFYPLVMTYLMGLHGFMALAQRGVIDLHNRVSKQISEPPHIEGVLTGVPDLDAGLRRLRAPLSLRAESIGRAINVPLTPLGEDVLENHGYLLPWLLPTMGSVLILAQEVVLTQLTEAERREPMLQFLRHTRNAVAHNGRWNFHSGEPKPTRPASWRRFTLDANMHGQNLFKASGGDGLLGPGDPIRLLWDIEQAYPHLKA